MTGLQKYWLDRLSTISTLPADDRFIIDRLMCKRIDGEQQRLPFLNRLSDLEHKLLQRIFERTFGIPNALDKVEIDKKSD